MDEFHKLYETAKALDPATVPDACFKLWLKEVQQQTVSEYSATALDLTRKQGPDVFKAVGRLLGVAVFAPLPNLDWESLQRDIVLIVNNNNMHRALVDWDNGLMSLNPLSYFFANFSGIVQAMLPQQLQTYLYKKLITEQECMQIVTQFSVLFDYLSTVADVEGCRVLYQTDDLILHHRKPGNGSLGELCLSFIQDNGFMSFFPLTTSKKVKPSSIKTMRAYVSSYKGPEYYGDISPHPDSKRLCSLINLKIRQNKAYLTQA